MIGHCPSNNFLSAQIDDGGQMQPAFPGMDVGAITNKTVSWCWRCEVPFQSIE